ncbi:Glycerate kinase [Raoultella terrigena]|uniref:Glycerate kinase n=1 Tax=Raoultella terrigena TaxID=577 RepID=A0A485CDJ5_RAOTE|nr:Glycerate kinase [Raoultella terrigena]
MKIVIAPRFIQGEPECAGRSDRDRAGVQGDLSRCRIPQATGRPTAGRGPSKRWSPATQGHLVRAAVTGPLGEPVNAFYGLSGDERCAYIEMAAASGLESVPPARRNPLLTTSWGTGELIRHALDSGVKQIIIGIGGSATNERAAPGWCRRWAASC